MPGFDPESFKTVRPDEKEKVAATWIRDALLELTKLFEIPQEAIHAGYARTVESGFKTEWVRKECTKSRGDRRLKLETHCTYDRTGVSVVIHFKAKQKTFAKTCTDRNRKLRGITFDYDSIDWDSDCVCIRNVLGDPYLRFRILGEDTVELLGSTKAVRLMSRGQHLKIEPR